MADENVQNQTEGKEVAVPSDDELMALMHKNAGLQEKENAGDGVKADYLILAKAGTKALSKLNEKLYVAGLKQGDIFIQKDKKVLGESVKVVPLAFITLFNEKEADTQDARFFGVWSKEQASTLPFADGSDYNHVTPNGHVLVPVNWVCVDVIGHPEIEHGVIAFKKTGSRIWREWKEDARKRSDSSATLVYTVTEAVYENKEFKWTDFKFEFAGSLLDTNAGKAQAFASLKKSNDIREAMANHTFVAEHDLASLAQKPVQAYIEDASDVEDSTDDEESGF